MNQYNLSALDNLYSFSKVPVICSCGMACVVHATNWIILIIIQPYVYVNVHLALVSWKSFKKRKNKDLVWNTSWQRWMQQGIHWISFKPKPFSAEYLTPNEKMVSTTNNLSTTWLVKVVGPFNIGCQRQYLTLKVQNVRYHGDLTFSQPWRAPRHISPSLILLPSK